MKSYKYRVPLLTIFHSLLHKIYLTWLLQRSKGLVSPQKQASKLTIHLNSLPSPPSILQAMKRFREGEDSRGDLYGTDVANWLMLLSRSGGGGRVDHEPVVQTTYRVFECKTCNRQFPSFQALGGHRASHKKPRLIDDQHNRVQGAKPRVHECSICSMEFAIGQALGGHMRRHRTAIDGFTEVPNNMFEEVGGGVTMKFRPT